MYCINCGTQIENKFKFCPKCGQKNVLELQTKEAGGPLKEASSPLINANSTTSTISDEAESLPTPIEKSAANEIMAFVYIFIACALITAFAYPIIVEQNKDNLQGISHFDLNQRGGAESYIASQTENALNEKLPLVFICSFIFIVLVRYAYKAIRWASKTAKK